MIKQRIKLLSTQYSIRDTQYAIRNTQYAIRNTNAKGTALLVVLFIVMAITILSLGFLSRSDVELACGQNMLLRTQMDYLAESGLEHSKGLIINPQNIDLESGTWQATGQQLDSESSDYYDVTVNRDSNDRCNYNIDCNSYRQKGDETIGRSSLTAELRLDPVIALWTEADTTLWSGVSINGDVRCGSTLTNQGAISGDVFGSLSGTDPNGQKYTVDKLSLDWPQIEIGDFTSYNTITQASLSGTTLDYAPWVFRRTGNLTLAGNIQVNGMLLVEGDLTVEGTNNVIVSIKNLPALYVTGDLIIEKDASLEIEGLAVVDNRVLVNGDAGLDVLGGLFTQDIFAETTADSSSNGNVGILYNGPTWNPTGGVIDGAIEFDGVDDYVSTGKSLLSGMSEFTLAGWVCENNSHESRIGLFGQNDTIEFGFDGGWLRVWTPGGGYAREQWLFEDFTWHHVAVVGDGNNLKIYIYIDGNLEETGSGPSYYGVSPYGFNIGGGIWDPSGNWFNGLLDDVRVYDKALDENAISCIYNDIYDPNHIPIGHWKMDESGSNVTITAAPEKTAILVGPEDNQERWGQAAGAFFRSIKRQ